MCSQTKNFNKLNFRTLSPVNSSASESTDSDKDSVVSDHFDSSSGNIVQPPREWWKIDPSNDIQMECFKRLSEVDLSVPETQSYDEISLFPRPDEVGFSENMVEEEEAKGY
jgi:hypothetical protein